jgi:hypothetical protein
MFDNVICIVGSMEPHAKGFEIVGSSGKNKISLGARW